MKAIIFVLLATCTHGSEVWNCKATSVCDEQTHTDTFRVCGTHDEVDKNTSEWIRVCGDAAGVAGCGTWICGETCEPTGKSCVEVDAR